MRLSPIEAQLRKIFGNWEGIFIEAAEAAVIPEQYRDFLTLMSYARHHPYFAGSTADEAALEAARRVLPESVTERSEFLGLMAERAPARSRVGRWALEVLRDA